MPVPVPVAVAVVLVLLAPRQLKPWGQGAHCPCAGTPTVPGPHHTSVQFVVPPALVVPSGQGSGGSAGLKQLWLAGHGVHLADFPRLKVPRGQGTGACRGLAHWRPRGQGTCFAHWWDGHDD